MNQHLTEQFQGIVHDRYARLDAQENLWTRRLRLALARDMELVLHLVEIGARAELVVATVRHPRVSKVVDALYLDVMVREAKYEYLHLRGEQKAAGLPLADWLRRAKNFIAVESSKAIVAITNTTRSEVKKVLKEAAEAGSGIAETGRLMRKQITTFSVRRAKTIARTELIGAAAAGSYAGALSTGLALDKVWLNTSDGRTRPTHLAAGGQRVDIKAPFIIGGETCRFPADPALSARERVNCRCAVGYKPRATPGTGLLDR